MSYDVAIIADSVGPNGARLTTFKLRYPRMIHQEMLTHRALSRNASSTRAIPVHKMIEWVEKDPARPVYWGKNQRGMQATEELSEDLTKEVSDIWEQAKWYAIHHAKRLMNAGVHKQIASRILEPFAHINVIVSSTSFDNFFALRVHPAAMPEIQALAVKMARSYRDSAPQRLAAGEWHLPFVTKEEVWECRYDARELSVARCARVSYETFDGAAPDPVKDVVLHDQLLASGHWSPFEHQARSQPASYGSDHRSGNFLGWTQYRQTLSKSVHESFDFAKLEEFGDRDFVV